MPLRRTDRRARYQFLFLANFNMETRNSFYFFSFKSFFIHGIQEYQGTRTCQELSRIELDNLFTEQLTFFLLNRFFFFILPHVPPFTRRKFVQDRFEHKITYWLTRFTLFSFEISQFHDIKCIEVIEIKINWQWISSSIIVVKTLKQLLVTIEIDLVSFYRCFSFFLSSICCESICNLPVTTKLNCLSHEITAQKSRLIVRNYIYICTYTDFNASSTSRTHSSIIDSVSFRSSTRNTFP